MPSIGLYFTSCVYSSLSENESSMGAKRLGGKGQGRTNWPGSEKGTKVPGSELARVLLADSLLGARWHGNEKAHRYHELYSKRTN